MAHPLLQKALSINRSSGRPAAVAFLKHEVADVADVSPEMAEGIASDAMDGNDAVLQQILELAEQLDDGDRATLAEQLAPPPIDSAVPSDDVADMEQAITDEGSSEGDDLTGGPAIGEEPPIGSPSDIPETQVRLEEDGEAPFDDDSSEKGSPALAGEPTAHSPTGPQPAPMPGRPTSGDGVVVGQLERAPKESEMDGSGAAGGPCPSCQKVHPGVECASAKWMSRLEKSNAEKVTFPKPLPKGEIAANILLGRKQTPEQRRNDPSKGGLMGSAGRALSSGAGGAGRATPLKPLSAASPGFPSDSSRRKADNPLTKMDDGCGCGGDCCEEKATTKWMGRLEKRFGNDAMTAGEKSPPSTSHPSEVKAEGYDFGGLTPMTPKEERIPRARSIHAERQAQAHMKPDQQPTSIPDAGLRAYARERGLSPEWRQMGHRTPSDSPFSFAPSHAEPTDEEAALQQFSERLKSVSDAKATLGQTLPGGSDSSMGRDRLAAIAPVPPKPPAPSARKEARDHDRLEKTVSALRNLSSTKKTLGLHGTQRTVLGRIMGLKALREIQKADSPTPET